MNLTTTGPSFWSTGLSSDTRARLPGAMPSWMADWSWS